MLLDLQIADSPNDKPRPIKVKLQIEDVPRDRLEALAAKYLSIEILSMLRTGRLESGNLITTDGYTFTVK